MRKTNHGPGKFNDVPNLMAIKSHFTKDIMQKFKLLGGL